jgi:ABC-type lipoprotein release transport system permease subunit
VLRLFVGQALRPVLAGAGVGLLLAWWAAPFLQEIVQVGTRGYLIFGVVSVTFVATGVAAAWLPARRASRTDPSMALREA